MATFHINRSGTSLGTFSEEDVRAGLRTGRFVGTDLGWRDGMPTWQPLAQISEFAQHIPAPGAAVPPSWPRVWVNSSHRSNGGALGLPWDDRQQKGFCAPLLKQ